MERIKSWVGQYVRIKREYIEYIKDPDTYHSCGESRLINTPFDRFFDDGELWSSFDNTRLDFGSRICHLWMGRVHAHVFGVDLLPSRNIYPPNEEEQPRHMLVIQGFPMENDWYYAWDAKYFEVVKGVKIESTQYSVDDSFKLV
jgi:hypothetical protein